MVLPEELPPRTRGIPRSKHSALQQAPPIAPKQWPNIHIEYPATDENLSDDPPTLSVLRSRRPHWRVIAKGASLYRLYPLAHDDQPLHFGRGRMHRWDAPDGSYGVLYVGDTPHTAFLETFGRETATQVVALEELSNYGLVRIQVSAALNLVDLTDWGLRALGADQTLTTGPTIRSQRWSAAVHRAFRGADGFVWRSRLDASRESMCIFESRRAWRAVTIGHRVGSLTAPANAWVLADILDLYQIALV
jgi:RES domain-containing protein